MPYNVVDYTPLLRAALANLVNWVADGAEPPPSKYPRLDDGTAVEQPDVLATFDRLPDITTPDPAKLWALRTLDMGPRSGEGVGSYPPKEGAAYRCLVSAVDEDGNELSGIRLPDISRPVATHTGWNTRAPETGSPDQQIPMIGFSRWFPASVAQQQADGDPRRAIEERYGSREDYESQVRSDTQSLVEAGYILPGDMELVVRNAVERYDYALEIAKAGVATG